MARLINLKAVLLFCAIMACNGQKSQEQEPPTEPEPEKTFVWNNANVYFLLTDRFNNGDPSNDQMYDRQADGARLRSFAGGDIKGVTQKINDGYFETMGIT
ncbi:MAG: alpha-amylase, partial [Bacteroidota bacterium]